MLALPIFEVTSITYFHIFSLFLTIKATLKSLCIYLLDSFMQTFVSLQIDLA